MRPYNLKPRLKLVSFEQFAWGTPVLNTRSRVHILLFSLLPQISNYLSHATVSFQKQPPEVFYKKGVLL